MSRKKGSGYRPFYNDLNPIIDTTPAPRLMVGIKSRRLERSAVGRDVLMMRLTVELMTEQHDQCYWCGCLMWHVRKTTTMPAECQELDNRATFDHKIIFSKGGSDTKENGVAACWNCNNHRGDTDFEEYEKWPPG